MSNPTIRDSRIPCPNCKQGTLYWRPDAKLYVCTKCGIQEAALKTWIGAAEHRQKKKKLMREQERQWALDILGIEDELKQKKKTKQEKLWEDVESLIKKKEKKDDKP